MTSGFIFLFDGIQLGTRSLRSLETVIYWSITDLEAHNLYTNYIVIVPFWYKLTWLITCTLQCNKINLYHSMGKFSRWQIDDIFLLSPENRLWNFLQIVSSGGIKCMILYNCWGALINHLGHNVRKCAALTFGRAPSKRFRSASAFALSDQNLPRVHFGLPNMQSFFMQTTKTSIRLRRCTGWFEFCLGHMSEGMFPDIVTHFLLSRPSYSKLHVHLRSC